ncbi:putative O-methyltransferase YrrM [Mucilaginibacter gracilis]|uniref:Putative O-methyltransferase YrrM n=1 Tax=Mucilaginibacter gracilis TaxID=423350 RepID=A0A495IXH7_9SPHI|nr:hypothetical protein [Mucilaginibacter gracilis]RKR81407.1 putative O-methyltransferase YrrM [Mucilaginibacter gracilis]
MIFSFVKDYVRHRLATRNSQVINSPFVYKLLNNVIYNFDPCPVYTDIENNKRKLLPNNRRRGNRPKADQLLYRLACHFNPKRVIEIGTGMGISKQYLSRAVPNAAINSFEQNGAFKHIASKINTVDFAFINYYNPAELFNCFEMLLPRFNNDSVLVICNIYGSPQAKQNFQSIKLHPRVTATVDLFWLQLVFFSDELAKEHYKLKF